MLKPSPRISLAVVVIAAALAGYALPGCGGAGTPQTGTGDDDLAKRPGAVPEDGVFGTGDDASVTPAPDNAGDIAGSGGDDDAIPTQSDDDTFAGPDDDTPDDDTTDDDAAADDDAATDDDSGDDDSADDDVTAGDDETADDDTMPPPGDDDTGGFDDDTAPGTDDDTSGGGGGTTDPTCPAAADCGGLACGIDPVCGTSCGDCPAGHACNFGVCELQGTGICPAAADCSGRECGPDPECGTSCGDCPAGESCDGLGRCSGGATCVPDCGGKSCGDDGCGGLCGGMTCPPPGGGKLDNLTLYINAGDSFGDGYNSSPRDKRSYWALLQHNDDAAYPQYAGKDLDTLFPSGFTFKHSGNSGAQSKEIKDDVLGMSLPASTPGDILFTLVGGGNDLNDNVLSLTSDAAVQPLIDGIQANWQAVFDHLKKKYPSNKIVFLVVDVHDPTDGTGKIPANFNNGFCKQLNNPLLQLVAPQMLASFDKFNAGIHDVTTQNGYIPIMWHDAFIGHGMNGGNERWLDTDCTHPTNDGHALLRALMWEAITGERP